MPTSADFTRTEKLLLEAARIFNSTMEYEEVLRLVLHLVMTAVNAEAALVFRIDHERTDMKIRFMKSGDEQPLVFLRELGRGVIGWVAQYREPLILNHPEGDPRVDPEIAQQSSVQTRNLISVPLIGKGQMIGVIEAFNKRDGDFTDADLDILTGLNNQVAVAIDNAHLYRNLKREALEKNLLYEVGKKLSSTLELDDVLRAILDSLKQVVPYDVGGVFLIDPKQGQIASIYTVGYNSEQDEKLQLKIGQGIIGHVVTTGQGTIVDDVSADPRYIMANSTTRSEIVAPIKIGDRVIGVINLESNTYKMYGLRDMELISTFASQAAISLERARLHRSLLEGKKLEEQLNIAREIQRSFLPKTDPTIPGYDIVGTNISSGQVGGDYYDFIRIVDSHTGVALGDVSGKGMPAALIMASFRASLIAEIRNNYSIRTICRKVNSLMLESLEPGNYVTAVYGVLDSRNHIFTFSNCGHNLPILLRKNGEVEFLREGGPILGVSEGAVYEERALMINPGEIIVLYTDGVTEVFDKSGKEFGLDRVVSIVKKNKTKSAREIQDAIHTAVDNFAAANHMFDDLTMVVIKRLTNAG